MGTNNSGLNKKDNTEQNDLASWIQGALSHLNTDFPLSGGETGEGLTDADDNVEEHEGFLHGIDTNFPLSGGSNDEDK